MMENREMNLVAKRAKLMEIKKEIEGISEQFARIRESDPKIKQIHNVMHVSFLLDRVMDILEEIKEQDLKLDKHYKVLIKTLVSNLYIYVPNEYKDNDKSYRVDI